MARPASSVRLLSPADNYNNFFHPNVCHVCKTTKGLMECPSCRMISYCGEEHRMLHRAQHNEICQAILTCSMHWSIYNSRGKTSEEWTEFKAMNTQCIMYSLNRDLEPHEREMFLFAKSCIVCRVQDNLVATCVGCYSVNVCANHYMRDGAHSCGQLSRCFSLHIESVIRNNRDSKVPTKCLFLDKSAVHDMPTFVRACVQRGRKTSAWVLNDYIHTDDFSGPLTLIYAMQRAKLSQRISGSLIVHVVTGGSMDTRGLSAWEILLHELPQRTRLTIVMIGQAVCNKNLSWRCCLNCREGAKELQFEYRRVLCHKYTRGAGRGAPDVVVGFNVDPGDNKICPDSIKASWRQRRLLILTATSESKAAANVKWVRKALGSHVAPLVQEKNPFASLRPLRDHENDSVFYPNQHLVVYRNFNNVCGTSQATVASVNDRVVTSAV